MQRDVEVELAALHGGLGLHQREVIVDRFDAKENVSFVDLLVVEDIELDDFTRDFGGDVTTSTRTRPSRVQGERR